MELPILTDEEIVARWGVHPTTGDVTFYRSLLLAQRDADLKAVQRHLAVVVVYTDKMPPHMDILRKATA